MLFSELRRTIPGITQQMLTAQLRELEADGTISRTAYPVVPPKVEYALTPFGAKLKAVTDALETWGREIPVSDAHRVPGRKRPETVAAQAGNQR